MKTLILYTSKTGNTKAYAEDIGRQVSATVAPLKGFRAKKMLDYDTIVFGGWVQGGTIKGLDKFLSNYKSIEKKNVIVFSVGMSIPSSDARSLMIEQNLLDMYHVRYYQFRGSFDMKKLHFPENFMNEDAQKRLQAIQEFTELGSGYKIAQRDLMIRGAGDILGAEQAGFIDTVGLDLYMKLLNEAIEEKKTGVTKPEPKPNKLFNIDAYIPKDYAINSDKIELYQELENVKDEKELLAYQKHMRDVYGRLPEEVTLLIQKKRIDLYTSQEEFTSVEEYEIYIDILMSDLGPIQYEQNSGSVFLGRDYANTQRNFSSEVAFEIDKAVREIIDSAHKQAIEILTQHKADVTLIAETLLEKETITAEEIESLIKTGKLPEKPAATVKEKETHG